MPQGTPSSIPDDGLTTRERRNRPLLMVHTGEMKGKSTAAFGMALRAWNQGWSIGVFQFVKSAKWRGGEEAAFKALGKLHGDTGGGVRGGVGGGGGGGGRAAEDGKKSHPGENRPPRLGRDQTPAGRRDTRLL